MYTPSVTNQTFPQRVYPQKELLVNPAECEGHRLAMAHDGLGLRDSDMSAHNNIELESSQLMYYKCR